MGAVARAKQEIDELAQRRCSAEARAKFLAEENHASAEALRRVAPCTAAVSSGNTALSGLGTADAATAPSTVSVVEGTVELRRLLLGKGATSPAPGATASCRPW